MAKKLRLDYQDFEVEVVLTKPKKGEHAWDVAEDEKPEGNGAMFRCTRAGCRARLHVFHMGFTAHYVEGQCPWSGI